MFPRLPRAVLIAILLLAQAPQPAHSDPAHSEPVHSEPAIRIVAAETVYGDIARQIAGPAAAITSILSNPDQDPHLFEASPAVARALSHADLTIANGGGYDPWMDTLLAATRVRGRRQIELGRLIGAHAGANPHFWYDLRAVRILADALAMALDSADPAGQGSSHAVARDRFLASLTPIEARIAAIRARHAGTQVSATEPVFGLMAASLGLVMNEERFQLAVMNDSEPDISDVATFENDLRRHRVGLFIYNRQASNGAAQRLLGIARAAGIPVVGVSETEPAGTSYQRWMEDELDAVDRALSAHPS